MVTWHVKVPEGLVGADSRAGAIFLYRFLWAQGWRVRLVRRWHR